MITEFIDGLQQFHFLQNAFDRQPSPSGLSLEPLIASIISRGMFSMETPSHTSSWCGSLSSSFILGINFFIILLALTSYVCPYHLYIWSEQPSSSRATLQLYYLSSSLPRVILD